MGPAWPVPRPISCRIFFHFADQVLDHARDIGCDRLPIAAGLPAVAGTNVDDEVQRSPGAECLPERRRPGGVQYGQVASMGDPVVPVIAGRSRSRKAQPPPIMGSRFRNSRSPVRSVGNPATPCLPAGITIEREPPTVRSIQQLLPAGNYRTRRPRPVPAQTDQGAGAAPCERQPVSDQLSVLPPRCSPSGSRGPGCQSGGPQRGLLLYAVRSASGPAGRILLPPRAGKAVRHEDRVTSSPVSSSR